MRSLGGPEAWEAPEGGLQTKHLQAAARSLALFDAVLTLEAIDEDAPAQMARVGLAGLGAWPRSFSRSRAENLQRAAHMPALRSAGGRPSCDVPPTAEQLGRLVAASAWDAVLHEFARVLARRRTQAYREGE